MVMFLVGCGGSSPSGNYSDSGYGTPATRNVPTNSIDERDNEDAKIREDAIVDAIKVCKETGFLVKMDTDGNKAWVDSSLWRAIGYDDKEKIAYLLAQYCEIMGDSSWCYVIDSKSGKKLAKYSSWGFKVY